MAFSSETGPTFEFSPLAIGIGLLLAAAISYVIWRENKPSDTVFPTSVDRMNDMHDEK